MGSLPEGAAPTSTRTRASTGTRPGSAAVREGLALPVWSDSESEAGWLRRDDRLRSHGPAISDEREVPVRPPRAGRGLIASLLGFTIEVSGIDRPCKRICGGRMNVGSSHRPTAPSGRVLNHKTTGTLLDVAGGRSYVECSATLLPISERCSRPCGAWVVSSVTGKKQCFAGFPSPVRVSLVGR